jgi:polysaccharide deacetylase family protein (PEP-CTERM system associated)
LHPPAQQMLEEHGRYASASPRNAMTVDVEEYFQVAAFEDRIRRDAWERYPARAALNTGRVLDAFAEHGVHATFFMLGWVAEREPALVRRIVDEGHELASHGYDHRRATMLDRAAFVADVTRTKKMLEDLSGRPVRGYRAPSYSIGTRNLWALEALREAGYAYSSSIYPIRHDLYGWPSAPRFAFRLHRDAILELPVTTVEVAGAKLPAGGGGYFRLLPYGMYAWALRRVNARDRQPGIFYFHPWELDPGQPRIDGASLRSRFRHYVNLDVMEGRLRRLLRDFRWGRMDEVFPIA